MTVRTLMSRLRGMPLDAVVWTDGQAAGPVKEATAEGDRVVVR